MKGIRKYASYPTEVKQAIVISRNISLFPELKIPRSTAYGWIKKGLSDSEINKNGLTEATKSFNDLVKMSRHLFFIVEKYLDLNKLHSSELDQFKELFYALNPNLRHKLTLKRLEELLPTNKSKKCLLTESGSCLRKYPNRIAKTEIRNMQRLLTSKKYRHFSIPSLVWYAKRKGLVSCSKGTWYRYIKSFNWQRPTIFAKHSNKKRKPGIRAKSPDEIWHVDISEIKLDSGAKHYLQAVVDNFSRYIVAWSIKSTKKSDNTVNILSNTLKNAKLRRNEILLLSDSGGENCSDRLESTLSAANPRIIHRLAKKDISNSNAMVESFFHGLKNRYLKGEKLQDLPHLKQVVSYYVDQYNYHVPHDVLDGLTSFEKYSGKSTEKIGSKIDFQTKKLRQNALKVHSRVRCQHCKKALV